MRFFSFYSLYSLLIVSLLALADQQGWRLGSIGRGGLGRSYTSYNHK